MSSNDALALATAACFISACMSALSAAADEATSLRRNNNFDMVAVYDAAVNGVGRGILRVVFAPLAVPATVFISACDSAVYGRKGRA